LVIKICDIKFKLHFIQQHYLKRQPYYPLPRETETESNRSDVRLHGSPTIIMHTKKSKKTAIPISVEIIKLFTTNVTTTGPSSSLHQSNQNRTQTSPLAARFVHLNSYMAVNQS